MISSNYNIFSSMQVRMFYRGTGKWYILTGEVNISRGLSICVIVSLNSTLYYILS